MSCLFVSAVHELHLSTVFYLRTSEFYLAWKLLWNCQFKKWPIRGVIFAFVGSAKARKNSFNVCFNIRSILLNDVDCLGGEMVSTYHQQLIQ